MYCLYLVLILFVLSANPEPEYEFNHIQKAADCPPYDSYRYLLLARKLGCSNDKPMHCAQLMGSKRYTVRCLKPMICTQGQQPFIQDRSDTVSCGDCYGDTYNHVPSQPSYSYSECTPMTELDKGRIPCEHLELRTSDPDYHKNNRYIRCNVSEDYILDDQLVNNPSRNLKDYCTNQTDPICIKYSCAEGLELIKNYSCVKACTADQYRDADFTCVERPAYPMETSGHLLVTKNKVSVQQTPSTVSQTTLPLQKSSTDGNSCYVYMNSPRFHHKGSVRKIVMDLKEALLGVPFHLERNGKVCRNRRTPKRRPRKTSCKKLLNKRRFNCCKIAKVCNEENYCGRGEMMCHDRHERENPKCVCPRGWYGHRCKKCSPKFKVPCWCHLGNHVHLFMTACSSNDADPGKHCWTHHRINDQNHTCVCRQDEDELSRISDARCSGDTRLCVKTRMTRLT